MKNLKGKNFFIRIIINWYRILRLNYYGWSKCDTCKKWVRQTNIRFFIFIGNILNVCNKCNNEFDKIKR